MVAKLPFAAIYPESIYLLLWLVVSYLVLMGLLLCRKKVRAGVMAVALLGVAVSLCTALAFTRQERLRGEFQFTALDVGQGQCLLLTSGEQTAAIDALMGYPLLIIDDLGVERDTPYAMEQVFHLIDARYRSKKPMIITTNLTMQELENPDTREKQRIYSRVLERCTPVQVEGRPIRAEKQRENRSFARAHLT